VEKYCTAGQATDDSIIWRMRISRCVTKAYDTNSEYVIHIAYALQQSFRERASMLRYTQSACLVLEFRRTYVRLPINSGNLIIKKFTYGNS
jgi:hypothetical protein